MPQPIIEVNNVSKSYTISHRVPYDTFRDTLTELAKKPFRMLTERKKEKEEFWALKKIYLSINEGEKIGIIGRNGAGKSTLLKILSQITPPTTGEIRLRGRVASLLEVGTGFHPELTGRENIFLNGAILGMRRKEIAKKFDEIVAFAEIEKFLDTPVKRYSSGMYLRLAFAVAAHLESEILIIDEVLAVGDAQFQKKCLGKMEEVGNEGRTVIFVSHNMGAIESLCTSCLILDHGNMLQKSSGVRQVIQQYLSSQINSKAQWAKLPSIDTNPWFIPERIEMRDLGGNQVISTIRNDQPYYLYLSGTIEQLNSLLTIGYAFYAEDGTLLFWSFQTDAHEKNWPRLQVGANTLVTEIPAYLLNGGVYHIEFISAIHFRQWLYEPGQSPVSMKLTVQGGLSSSPYWTTKRPGVIAPMMKWKNVTTSLDRSIC